MHERSVMPFHRKKEISDVLRYTPDRGFRPPSIIEALPGFPCEKEAGLRLFATNPGVLYVDSPSMPLESPIFKGSEIPSPLFSPAFTTISWRAIRIYRNPAGYPQCEPMHSHLHTDWMLAPFFYILLCHSKVWRMYDKPFLHPSPPV